MATGAPVIFSNPVVPTLVEEEDVSLISVSEASVGLKLLWPAGFIKFLVHSIKSKEEEKIPAM